MGLAKRVDHSIGYWHANYSKVQQTPTSIQREENKLTLDEIFDEVIREGFTLDEALEFMDITESEFLELLKKSGNCPSGKLDKSQKYSTELILKIDPGKWKDPNVYKLKDVFGDLANNKYTLNEALKILKFSKAEFQEQLVENGYCSAEEFDKIDEFPFEWIWVLDPHK